MAIYRNGRREGGDSSGGTTTIIAPSGGKWTPTISAISQKNESNNAIADANVGTVEIESATYTARSGQAHFFIFGSYTPQSGQKIGSFKFAFAPPFAVTEVFGSAEITGHVHQNDNPDTTEDEERRYGGQGGGSSRLKLTEGVIHVSIGIYTWAQTDKKKYFAIKGSWNS